ncbi:serine protease SP24D-like [Episyrphus balteatus]|uniref:serine protease SP24D-like n=1 Tax=Episyrphus balteatus TaxID=286459 RepID=UPI0024868E11|nr:serine protease SP24D-like [Episyrphus balteatus]
MAVFQTSLLVVVALVLCALVQAKPSARIVGGAYAQVGQFPHQVALYTNRDFKCGGSIVSSRYILTAASCVIRDNGSEIFSPKELSVRVGSMYRLNGGEKVTVKNVKVHENYKNQWSNNIALLELENELVFSSDVQKIDLFSGEVPTNSKVITSGWGQLYYKGTYPEWLKFNTVFKMDSSVCKVLIGFGDESLMCLGHNYMEGACDGDTGGPAIYDGKLVGVFNFSKDGCGGTRPDAYTTVSYHLDWINSNMN